MDLSDYVRFQIKHSCWAIEHLIMHAGRLPQDAIEQDMNIGPGSLRVNIAAHYRSHVLFRRLLCRQDLRRARGFRPVQFNTQGSLHAPVSCAQKLRRESMLIRHRPRSACDGAVDWDRYWRNARRGVLAQVLITRHCIALSASTC